MINLSNARVDRRFRVSRHGDGAFQNLGDEFLHQILAAFAGGRIAGKTTLFNDLVQQTLFALFDYNRRSSTLLGNVTHWGLLQASADSAQPEASRVFQYW